MKYVLPDLHQPHQSTLARICITLATLSIQAWAAPVQRESTSLSVLVSPQGSVGRKHRSTEAPPEDESTTVLLPNRLPSALVDEEVPVRRSSVSLNATNASAQLGASSGSFGSGGLKTDFVTEFEALRAQIQEGTSQILKETKTNEDLRREILQLRNIVHDRGSGDADVLKEGAEVPSSTTDYIHLGLIVFCTMVAYRLGIFALTYIEPVTRSSGLLADYEACGLCLAASTIVCGLMFGLAIPSSYDVAVKLGHSAAYSGRIIGTFPLGVVVGCFIMHKMLKRYYTLAREKSKTALVLSMACLAIGSVIYALGADLAFDLSPALATNSAAVETQRSFATSAIFAGRLLSGFGAGTFYRFTAEAFVHLQWMSDKARVNRIKMYTLVSPCIGFLAIGLADEATTQSLSPASKTVAMVAAIACTHLAWAIYNCPHLDEGLLTSRESMDASTTDGTSSQRSMVSFDEDSIRGSAYAETGERGRREEILYRASCLIFGLLISYCLASVEVVSTMILEANYCWRVSRVAIAVGLTHLAVVPVVVYVEGATNKVTPQCIIRMMIAFSLFATFCYVSLENVNCSTHVDIWHFMPLLGDLLSFPCLAIAFRMAMPSGSVISETSARTFQTFLFAMCYVLARSVSPIGARWWCDKAQDYFALTQACVLMVALFIFEVGLRPNMPESMKN
jgi:hypothetical protein